MALPAYAVDFRGFPACPCLAEWLPAYEHELQRRGILEGPLHIYQLIGDAAASGNTHPDGGAFDLVDLPGDVDLEVGRQMGADAYWTRPEGWDGPGSIRHNHGVLRGCPHNEPARYQIAAVDAGYNGLGYLGHGAPDDGPRPLSGRTWREGIQWAKAQEQADDMQLSDKLYPNKPDSPTVGEVLRRMDRFIDRTDARNKADAARDREVLAAIDQLPDGATKADVRRIVARELEKAAAAAAQDDAGGV